MRGMCRRDVLVAHPYFEGEVKIAVWIVGRFQSLKYCKSYQALGRTG